MQLGRPGFRCPALAEPELDQLSHLLDLLLEAGFPDDPVDELRSRGVRSEREPGKQAQQEKHGYAEHA
jgi:hypothetical protein